MANEPRKTIFLDIPETSVERIALADSKKLPKCWGVSRMADNEKAILTIFERPLTDNEMRYLHKLIGDKCT